VRALPCSAPCPTVGPIANVVALNLGYLIWRRGGETVFTLSGRQADGRLGCEPGSHHRATIQCSSVPPMSASICWPTWSQSRHAASARYLADGPPTLAAAWRGLRATTRTCRSGLLIGIAIITVHVLVVVRDAGSPSPPR
jgi:hypothetical protein